MPFNFEPLVYLVQVNGVHQGLDSLGHFHEYPRDGSCYVLLQLVEVWFSLAHFDIDMSNIFIWVKLNNWLNWAQVDIESSFIKHWEYDDVIGLNQFKLDFNLAHMNQIC